MNTYETLFIINPEIGDGEIAKTIDIIQDVITSGGGTILKTDKWGKRQLAYEIRRKREGYYVLMHFRISPAGLIELNRRFKLTDAILRNLILQLSKDQIADLLQSIDADAGVVSASPSFSTEAGESRDAVTEQSAEIPDAATEQSDERDVETEAE